MMGIDPVNLQAALTPKQQLVDLLKDYLNDSRLFTAALEELQGQLSKIESELSRSRSKPSDVMKGVLEKANTLKFKQYIEGSLPPPPQPDLAAGIDENISLLRVLCSEMNKFVAHIESIEEGLKMKLQDFFERFKLQQEEEQQPEQTDGVVVGVGSIWEQAANDALLAAATVDAVKQDFILIRKVTDAVSILTPSAEISSYVTILNVQPYLPTSLVEEILSWRKNSSS